MARAKKGTQRKSSREAKSGARATMKRAGTKRPSRPSRSNAGAHATVRMYRTGLGDCFLLSFPRAGQRPFHMLVDCGVFFQTPNERPRLEAVAAAIQTATRDGDKSHLDVLVATHEHYDHLIGFKHAKAIWEKFSVGEVWMAWADQPGHPQAAWLRKIEDKLRTGLSLALQDAQSDPSLDDRREALESLLEFDGNPLAADYSDQLGEIKRWLREEIGAKVTYLEPHGKARPLGDVPDARVYVLGPPLQEKFLRKMNDSKSDPETYSQSLTLSAVPAFLGLGSAGRDSVEAEEQALLQTPFEPHWQVKESDARTDRRTAHFLEEHYGFDENDRFAWRRIRNDWMTSAEELALQLNSLTNNSSLALAIEVGPSRRVILMVADAQVGNWLSWHEGKWTAELPDGTREVSAEELLRRTVLYKVGHHGSHNATLKQRGLELMTSDELVAMIPVDERFARDVKHWEMPYGHLLKELEARTRGRVMRVDEGLPQKSQVEQAVRDDFFERASATDLYVEYTVPMEG